MLTESDIFILKVVLGILSLLVAFAGVLFTGLLVLLKIIEISQKKG